MNEVFFVGAETLFSAPYNQATVLQAVDPTTGGNPVAVPINNPSGSITTYRYGGIALGGLGTSQKLYCVPLEENRVQVLDPANPSVGQEELTHSKFGVNKYMFEDSITFVGQWGVCAPAGYVPSPWNDVMFINSGTTPPALTFVDTGETGSYKWSGVAAGTSTFGGGDTVFASPYWSANVLIIGVSTQTVDTSLSTGRQAGGFKWAGLVLHPSTGRLFGCPFNENDILRLETWSLPYQVGPFENSGVTSGEKWWGGALGLNDLVVFAPYNNDNVLGHVQKWVRKKHQIGRNEGSKKEIAI